MPKFNHFLHTNPTFTSYFLSLLPFCRKSQELKAINSLIVVYGLIADQSLVKQFVQHCCRQGFPDVALPAFKKIEKPSLHLQNLVLRSSSDNGLFEDVLFVYKKCRNSGICSDNYTYPFVIKACAALSDFCFGKLIHSVVVRTGFGDNPVVQTALVDFYSKVGDMNNSLKLFDEMPQPELVAWNALISGYSVNGFDYEVFKVFQHMRVASMKPNASTLTTLFPVCSRVEIFCFGDSLYGLAYKLGYSNDDSLAPALISMYANCGNLLAATNIFDTSNRRNFAIWNAIISAYTRNRQPENAIALFRKMRLSDVKPNDVTFFSLLQSSDNIPNICTVESVHAHVVKSGFEKHLSISTALISTYAKLGNIVSSELLLNYVPTKNLLLWNSMVSSYAGNGLWKKSLHAFCSMQINGFYPDAISIISILSSCPELEATLLGKSTHGFTLRKGINSNLNLSNAFLAFYCDCNELAYSLRIFNTMVLKNVVSWNTVILDV